MKATELRIGNLINFFEDSTTFKVTSIDETGFEVKNKKEETWIESYAFEPIKLTPEWLAKSGFNRDSEGWFLSAYDKLYDPLIPDGIGGYCQRNTTIFAFRHGDYVLKPAIRYVHELQNLYFALTGEELTIKA